MSVNGVIVQEAHLRDMRLGMPELIESLSSGFAFQAGDVISTGTWEAAACPEMARIV